MTKTDIVTKVRSHYSKSSEPLLLSDLGKLLRSEKLWPVEGESKLADYLIKMKPDIDVIRDSSAPSYAVVVTEDKKEIADQAIKIRQDRSFLRSLPKSVLIAFVANAIPGARVYLQITPPFRYQFAAIPPSEQHIEVPAQNRFPGLNADEVLEWRADTVRELAPKVRSWLEENGVIIDFVAKNRQESNIQAAEPKLVKALPESQASMLERLYAAQKPSVADAMVIPFDIAVLLSKNS